MSDSAVILEEVVDMARGLSALDKVRLVEEVMTLLEADIEERKVSPKPSLYGIWPDARVSEEDIAEVRQEMWSNIARKDMS